MLNLFGLLFAVEGLKKAASTWVLIPPGNASAWKLSLDGYLNYVGGAGEAAGCWSSWCWSKVSAAQAPAVNSKIRIQFQTAFRNFI